MNLDWYAGQKVECVKAFWEQGAHVPQVGEKYTVKDAKAGFCCPTIELCEISPTSKLIIIAQHYWPSCHFKPLEPAGMNALREILKADPPKEAPAKKKENV